MDWLNGLRNGVWGIIVGLIGLALLAEFGIGLGHYLWAWVAGGNNALVLIALAIVGGAAAAVAHTSNQS